MTHKSEQVCRLQHDMNSLLGIILHDETFDLDNVLRTLNAVREAMSEVYVHQDEQETTKKAPYSQ